MISSFSQYLVEEERTVYFTFGRMNPPTVGHGKLLDKLAASAGRNPYRVYLSQTQDSKKNPLSYTDKVKHVRKMFPKHARSVMINKKIKTAMDVATALYNEGFRSAVFVVGSDRVREFDILMNKYNGQKARHGFYNFKSIKVISAGQRDPDAEGVEGMSASKMRKFVADNDFTSFSQGVPKAMSNSDARKLFNAVRVGMGLKEEKTFKNHIQLEKVSERREQFAAGNLFSISDEVVIKETNDVGVIQVIGSNYVIVEFNGQRKRFWLDAVEKIQEAYEIGTPEYTAHAKKMTPGQKETQDPDIKDREGTQPKRYHAGLKKATKIRRDRHFKKHGKKADNDPSAYKPAPGDANAETKPSKYTKIVNKMVGENKAQDLAKMRIDREKKADAKRHDRMMDRARMKDTQAKNKDTSVKENSFADKSKASGVSVGTLKKVYNRGVAAWKTGHRPGTTPSQWGHARVNAFIAKKKKGNLNHDKDLA